MRTAIFVMIVVGTAIGSVLPAGKPRAVPPPAATEQAAAAPSTEAPRETVIRRDDNGHFYAFANVNSEPIRFVVDTGATMVALTTEDARRAHIEVDPGRMVPVGYGANGQLTGQPVTVDRIELDGKSVGPLRAVVLPNLSVSLLGQSWLRQIGTVEIRNDEMRLK